MDKLYIIGRDQVPQEIAVGANEKLDMTLIILPGVSCSLNLDVTIEGEGAEVNISGLYVCGGSDKVTISVNMIHKVGRCTSRQLFKGIVGDRAKTDFYGRIVVVQDAQKTEAYQANHNLLLSDEARADARPQLEIYADDVKCSHGATVGRLNEEEQFYMRSRGISLPEAKVLQMLSFVSPVLATIDDSAARERISVEVEDAIRLMSR